LIGRRCGRDFTAAAAAADDDDVTDDRALVSLTHTVSQLRVVVPTSSVTATGLHM